MRIPHKPRRSTRPRKNDRGNCVASIPEVKVVVGKNAYGREVLADAHFLLRRRCYQYLRWRDGVKLKEFYLGESEKSYHTAHLAGAGGSPRPLCGEKTMRPTIKSEFQFPSKAGFCVNTEVVAQIGEFRKTPLCFLMSWNPARIEEIFGSNELAGSNEKRASAGAVRLATETAHCYRPAIAATGNRGQILRAVLSMLAIKGPYPVRSSRTGKKLAPHAPARIAGASRSVSGRMGRGGRGLGLGRLGILIPKGNKVASNCKKPQEHRSRCKSSAL